MPFLTLTESRWRSIRWSECEGLLSNRNEQLKFFYFLIYFFHMHLGDSLVKWHLQGSQKHLVAAAEREVCIYNRSYGGVQSPPHVTVRFSVTTCEAGLKTQGSLWRSK